MMSIGIFLAALLLFYLLFAGTVSRAAEKGQGDTLGDVLHIGALVAVCLMVGGLGVAVYWMNGLGWLS
ncbi:hypothetical protein MF069_12820 [Paenibacillus mucilaginosus]|uniref:Uncharacterized protein n=2 Tax=Paenibacillus mucilaginosus TaxID=61624 RepID=F8FET3_PAEMK|nr:hypothetical protein [Paenibacillus mucilaginosus]AEI46168.1 hypothetical protein KNP414_07682 [Paenibacillus mucilaginosus KNP414]MCG7213700.1 hypothetical protein [Paenibacillus mucilaginosus]WDM27496.1 hypothetical protein KCX80_34990 [Paenibacillus mucilaginosus]WFA22180.1 hypothetical protein ERY13_35910 [Paenibacillus mucilaginosus]